MTPTEQGAGPVAGEAGQPTANRWCGVRSAIPNRLDRAFGDLGPRREGRTGHRAQEGEDGPAPERPIGIAVAGADVIRVVDEAVVDVVEPIRFFAVIFEISEAEMEVAALQQSHSAPPARDAVLIGARCTYRTPTTPVAISP